MRRTHALRLSERSEETQKASALHCRDSSYRRKVGSPSEGQKQKKRRKHALRLSERREETQKVSAFHCRDSSYRGRTETEGKTETPTE